MTPNGNIIEQIEEASMEIASEHANEDYCGIDFVWGQANSNKCDERANHTIATDYSHLTRHKCITAANRSGAKTADPMMIPLDSEDERPEGCFMYPCTSVKPKGDQCYYYNEDGDLPPKPQGVPVCERPRYLYGKSIANKGVKAKELCDNDEYMVIDDINDCKKAASCLGLCVGEYFNVDDFNASKDLEYPPGCFENILDERKCVYFKRAVLGPPTKPVGEPICKVKGSDRVGETPFPK